MLFRSGVCNSGCPYERKRSPDQTYVPAAIRHGAELMTRAQAWKLEHRKGRVRGLLVRRQPVDGSPPETLRVTADRYVLSAGAINSAAILLRSGIRWANAGKWLSFNVGTALIAEFEEVLDAHLGDDMCAYLHTRDFTIESTINPPGALALFMAGYFEDHYARMLRYRHLMQTGVLVPIQPNASVRYGWIHRLLGHELVHYQPLQSDLMKLRAGLQQAGEILFAGGASRVYLPLAVPSWADSPTELEEKLRLGFHRHTDLNSFGSAHLFGGARLSADPKRGTVGTDFRVHGMENLYVADASVFPSAPGVNPWISISTVADYMSIHALGLPPLSLPRGRVPFPEREVVAELGDGARYGRTQPVDGLEGAFVERAERSGERGSVTSSNRMSGVGANGAHWSNGEGRERAAAPDASDSQESSGSTSTVASS